MTTPTPMTDNIITREQAAIAMLNHERVESSFGDGWFPALPDHFKVPDTRFRRPPEPRREAREGYVALFLKDGSVSSVHFPGTIPDWAREDPGIEFAHVREVLPGDVVLERMTRNEARTKLREWGVSNNDAAGGAMTTLIELGLIADLSALGEGS